ncbi:uncharacterized protein HMPREF1541_05939 [Cyphellophora europaea CBS 101466]|uniref:Uncharacterized protein n=1 Tax=Cyphellophora europaea (strain CBS 101466) TaxID=1220924 RepID=W2RVA7_CYPE1|nr:uncharacterized protein HMPREF1541_05939 [Cyphellophora europaea CBS 101466]ETN39713.1 hypothetical protein HMPREF1541_05939 [Cyphellophora europaea CBS 101466]
MAVSHARQQAFQQLRPPCVELSAIALRFKGSQATVKQVFHALQDVQRALESPNVQAALDAKLAEYAFFPLTHIFNSAQSLSSTCLESAIRCVIILLSKGWRSTIAPEMGKQLLILMSLLAGGQTRPGGEAPTAEIKALAFRCVEVIVQQLTQKDEAHQLLNDPGSRNIIDQLVYLLLESVTDSESDNVQLASSEALHAIVSSISSRMTLASLLPRTASSLTQALRTSTKARRTRKVLSSYLALLRDLLRAVLADDVVFPPQASATDTSSQDEQLDKLDDSWLRATTEQVKIALTQVMRLRSHDHIEVRDALADLCLMVIGDCLRSLSDSLPITVETLIHLAQFDDSASTKSKVEFLMTSQPVLVDILKEKLYNWCRALPRTMRTSEDRPKVQLFGQIRAALSLLSHVAEVSEQALSKFAGGLIEGLNVFHPGSGPAELFTEQSATALPSLSQLQTVNASEDFRSLLFERTSEHGSAHELRLALDSLTTLGYSNHLARVCVDRLADAVPAEQFTSAWLALQSLSGSRGTEFNADSFIEAEGTEGLRVSKPQIVSDLYAAALPWLVDEEYRGESSDWRLVALAIEVAVLQAQQLDVSYRPELLETLYPMLSLLGGHNTALREHAMTGLNLLATACQYPSTSHMLIENADYLINSVGMKLNAFDVTPQAPHVLLMTVRLCGARIVPQLDDLIGSMFSALDNFHGYPRLVEALFQVLRVMVDESKKRPNLTITNGMREPEHYRQAEKSSSLNDILDDLVRRRTRKRKIMNEDDAAPARAPQKPWTDEVLPNQQVDQDMLQTDVDGPESQTGPQAKEEENKLSKSYKLLLSIAQSAVPHLTSPSPQVRQTLLQLLDEVAPLLAMDENSFLPLINSVWPVVAPRLLAYTPVVDDNEGETAYNACAAADVIATLCRGAGSFMSSRIDEIFPLLKKLFSDVESRRKPTKESKRDTKSLAVRDYSVATGRSPRSQVLGALIRLLSTILSFVRLTDDIGDQIVDMLVPYCGGVGQDVERALTWYNADAVWLWREKQSHAPPEPA